MHSSFGNGGLLPSSPNNSQSHTFCDKYASVIAKSFSMLYTDSKPDHSKVSPVALHTRLVANSLERLHAIRPSLVLARRQIRKSPLSDRTESTSSAGIASDFGNTSWTTAPDINGSRAVSLKQRIWVRKPCIEQILAREIILVRKSGPSVVNW